MTGSPGAPDGSSSERRGEGPQPHTRGRLRAVWDLFFRALRLIARHAHNAYAAFGIFLLVGALLAVVGTYAFAELARHVRAGSTQAFDERVLRWMGAHQNPVVTSVMLEITALGTGTVVVMMVAIAALFLWLNRHRYSALLLLVATSGGIVLNNLLKAGFERPRPDVFAWTTSARYYSFPSGHAMSATIAYSTVAYLAARLQRTRAARVALMLTAFVMIALICASRLYLGVHYPSDVAAGIVVGLAWAGFCMATLEAIQIYASRNAPQMLRDEHPAPDAAAAAPRREADDAPLPPSA